MHAPAPSPAEVATAARRCYVLHGLSTPPLPYLGRISYGMYLWYWPVLLYLTAARTHLHGSTLLLARMSVIVAVASVSFHLVETPIRRGALGGWRGWASRPSSSPRMVMALTCC